MRAQTLNALSLGTPSVAATLDVDFGAGATEVDAIDANNFADRAVHYAALVHDATAGELRLVTDFGETVTSAS